MENTLHITRRHEIITGLFFITATATAIIGLKLYMPVLFDPDPLGAAARFSGQVAWGALFEAILSIANIGTAFMLLPVLSRVSSRLGPAYTVFRSLEVVTIIIGLLSMLALVTVGRQFAAGAGGDMATGRPIAQALIGIHDWAFVLGPHFLLGVNTLIYSALFLRSGLVPGPLAVLGITGAVLILVVGAIELLGVITPYSTTTMVMALPIAVYEMILAGWLIVKGFNGLDRAI